MSQYEIAALVTAVFTGFLGGYVLAKGNRSVARLFGVYTLTICVWSLFFFFMISTENAARSLFWARVLHLPGALVPATFLHFTQSFLSIDSRKTQRYLRLAVYGIGFLLIPASFLHEFVRAAVPEPGFPHYYMGIGRYYHLFVGFFMGTVVIIHFLIIRSFMAETPAKRVQILYLLGSYAIGYAGGMAVFLPGYGIRLPAFALYSIPICHLLIAYSILRYRVMDLGLMIRWGVAFFLTIALMSLFVFVFVFILEKTFSAWVGFNKGVSTVVVACVLTLFFDSLKKKVALSVDTFVFKSADFQSILTALENELKKSNSLNEITRGLIDQFKKIWSVQHAGFVLWENSQASFMMYPRNAFEGQVIMGAKEMITQNDFLIKTLESERRLFKFGVVVDDELVALCHRASPGEKMTFEKIRRTMRWIGAAAAVPLMLNNQLIGFMVLGVKKNGLSYNEEDKKFLSHVAEMVALRLKQIIIGDMPNEEIGLTPNIA